MHYEIEMLLDSVTGSCKEKWVEHGSSHDGWRQLWSADLLVVALVSAHARRVAHTILGGTDSTSGR